MTSSKFVEILDNTETPYSRANVSLDDVLNDQTRHRSQSQASIGNNSERSSSPTSTTSSSSNNFATQPIQQIKTRVRGFSLMKNTKT